MAACGFKHGFQLRTPFAMKISSFSTVILTLRGAERLCLTVGTVEKGNDGSPLATYEGTSAVARGLLFMRSTTAQQHARAGEKRQLLPLIKDGIFKWDNDLFTGELYYKGQQTEEVFSHSSRI